VGCWTAKDQIDCLRGVSQADLYKAQQSLTWNPLIDGEFLTGYPSQLIREGAYNAVPLLIGANTDEGFAVGNPENDQELFHELYRWRNYGLSAPTIRKLMELYPDDPCHQPPYAITDCSLNPGRAKQWRRAVAIGADVTMISGRRKLAELYTEAGQPVYSYRFDQLRYGGPEWDGVKHFDNVQYSFQNISGTLGPSPEYDSHADLARAIGQAYVRFVYDLDPNRNPDYGEQETLLPEWPVYDLDAPKNMVLNATKNWVEDDTWRQEQLAYINSFEVARELYA
jgi:carboxylesterase type B